jgi:ubiquinone/menaquinone biosynthesis C-methylase UbiE
MDKPFWAKYRQEQLVSVDGEILEIGVGTGLNLPHYPKHVRRITTADPNPGMNKRVQRRIDQTGIEVDKQIISSESLPFEKGEFDCVVSTITLCSIPNVAQFFDRTGLNFRTSTPLVQDLISGGPVNS